MPSLATSIFLLAFSLATSVSSVVAVETTNPFIGYGTGGVALTLIVFGAGYLIRATNVREKLAADALAEERAARQAAELRWLAEIDRSGLSERKWQQRVNRLEWEVDKWRRQAMGFDPPPPYAGG